MLPPGPREPAALQTIEWIARPTAFLRRAQVRHGEPFTVRVAWADAPMVLVSDPESIRRVFTADPGALQGGSSSTVLEPFAGPSSILVLHGPEHLRQRKLLLPAFHGAALAGWQATTLDVILRVVFGAGDHTTLRDAIRRTLDMTLSVPRVVAMSLIRDERGPWGTFMRAVRAADEQIHRAIDGPAPAGSLLA